MADRAVVLCAPLCFIANRIGSTEIKVLKNVLKDYYGVDDIAVAKQRLIEDADIISGKVDLPHIVQEHHESRGNFVMKASHHARCLKGTLMVHIKHDGTLGNVRSYIFDIFNMFVRTDIFAILRN